LVTSLVDAGESVVMVMHSYGGAVGTSAVDRLGLASRKEEGKKGGVLHLLYLCAYMLEAGRTVWDIVQAAKFEDLFYGAIEVEEDGSTFPRDPKVMFFNGVSEEQTKAGMDALVRFPMSAMQARTEDEAWVEIPSTYVFTSEDYAVPGVYQTIMTERVKERGVVFGEERVESGHSAFLSRTKEMVDIVMRACDLGLGR
jgi:pimeloyl-ACP methyl ester carboxylesterase